MRLIDIENIDYVRLEDSLHCIEHHKGDEVECVICAPTVEAIPKDEYENRLKADMAAMLTDIKLKIEELPTLTADSEDGQGTEPTYSCWEVENLIQEHINALKETSND